MHKIRRPRCGGAFESGWRRRQNDSPHLFQKIIAGAALDSGVDARIEHWLHASADHPVAMNFPEGEYLKGLVLRVRV